MNITKQQMRDALNALRLARKESTQAMNRASYSKAVQGVFNALEKETTKKKVK